MAQRRPIAVVIGTRPEAVKLAPVVALLERSPVLRPLVVTTGQHRQVVEEVLDLFRLRSDERLDPPPAGGTPAGTTASMLGDLGELLPRLGPAAVLTQGDTASTLAAALAGFLTGIPVVHLEAGLRTGDVTSPFPEEMNRRLVTALATLHLAPTSRARDRLLAEGVDPAAVVVTGNTVVDALRTGTARAGRYADPRLAGLDGDPRRVLVLTAHRRESWGRPLERVAAAVAQLARERSDLLQVVCLHPHPAARRAFAPLAGLPGVILTEPQPYGPFLRLLRRADLVLTDSGGVQEEAPSLGTPVLVLRERTERTEGVAAGLARVVGTDTARIAAEVHRLLDDPAALRAMQGEGGNPYGDGEAARRSVVAIGEMLARLS